MRRFCNLLIVCAGTALASCAAVAPGPPEVPAMAPPVISAMQWGGTPADFAAARKHIVTRITLHHQGEAFPRGRDPAQYLRNLQSWSRTTKHWIDVPYHFMIDLDGNIYEGRDIAFAGDTNTEYDPAGHALIEVVGNFEEVEPSPSQLDALVTLMAWLAQRYSVPLEAIRGHRDYANTLCPGRNLYRYVENGYLRDQVRLRLAR